MVLENDMRRKRLERLTSFWSNLSYLREYLDHVMEKTSPVNGLLMTSDLEKCFDPDLRIDLVEDIFEGVAALMDRILAKNHVRLPCASKRVWTSQQPPDDTSCSNQKEKGS